MFGNVVIYRDPNDNIKLDKARSRDKIDGVVALVDAVGGWLNEAASEVKVYNDHEVRIMPNLW
jgi:phage terminase large subunit-like protein